MRLHLLGQLDEARVRIAVQDSARERAERQGDHRDLRRRPPRSGLVDVQEVVGSEERVVGRSTSPTEPGSRSVVSHCLPISSRFRMFRVTRETASSSARRSAWRSLLRRGCPSVYARTPCCDHARGVGRGRGRESDVDRLDAEPRSPRSSVGPPGPTPASARRRAPCPMPRSVGRAGALGRTRQERRSSVAVPTLRSRYQSATTEREARATAAAAAVEATRPTRVQSSWSALPPLSRQTRSRPTVTPPTKRNESTVDITVAAIPA